MTCFWVKSLYDIDGQTFRWTDGRARHVMQPVASPVSIVATFTGSNSFYLVGIKSRADHSQQSAPISVQLSQYKKHCDRPHDPVLPTSPPASTIPCYSMIKSNQIKSNQIKSNQIKSNQIKSNQIKSNQIKSNQITVYHGTAARRRDYNSTNYAE